MEARAFQPLYTPFQGTTGGSLLPSVTVSASTSAASTATPFSGTLNNQIVQIQIANQSSSWAYVNFGVQGNVTAATVAASYPVAPGGVVVVTVNPEVTGASVILGSGSGNVVFTRGEGL